jgi:hypothetical protein
MQSVSQHPPRKLVDFLCGATLITENSGYISYITRALASERRPEALFGTPPYLMLVAELGWLSDNSLGKGPRPYVVQQDDFHGRFQSDSSIETKFAIFAMWLSSWDWDKHFPHE